MEKISLLLMNGLLIETNMWIELGSITLIYLLIKIYLRIRRMIRIDHNLNKDEREAKYRDYEVLCDKNGNMKLLIIIAKIVLKEKLTLKKKIGYYLEYVKNVPNLIQEILFGVLIAM